MGQLGMSAIRNNLASITLKGDVIQWKEKVPSSTSLTCELYLSIKHAGWNEAAGPTLLA